ncbi:MAG: hypothetical protein CMG74_05465 [Candidatus Marinimicrobia bacterium]|nr:hypothetical protein [Candidatus Neomarinimicrobiota bacterium]|tara:strand:- start:1467 stop:1730 length:264 start_codon:yes stop_codon:yes gene_type:complete
MDQNKKLLLAHYIREFILGLLGLCILAGLFWYNKFEFTIRIIALWVFIFNGILMGYWMWKSNTKSWEKWIVIIYFILLEFIILRGGR